MVERLSEGQARDEGRVENTRYLFGLMNFVTRLFTSALSLLSCLPPRLRLSFQLLSSLASCIPIIPTLTSLSSAAFASAPHAWPQPPPSFATR